MRSLHVLLERISGQCGAWTSFLYTSLVLSVIPLGDLSGDSDRFVTPWIQLALTVYRVCKTWDPQPQVLNRVWPQHANSHFLVLIRNYRMTTGGDCKVSEGRKVLGAYQIRLREAWEELLRKMKIHLLSVYMDDLGNLTSSSPLREAILAFITINRMP